MQAMANITTQTCLLLDSESYFYTDKHVNLIFSLPFCQLERIIWKY